MFNIQPIGNPIFEAVTVADLKAHCRVYGTADDTYLATLRVAARQQVEQDLNMIVAGQTYRLYSDGFSPITLPLAPIVSVDEITYLDADGERQTLSADLYTVKNYTDPVTIDFTGTLPPGTGIQVDFTAGFTLDDPEEPEGANSVPQLIKHAIMFLVAHWFEHRESSSDRLVREVPQGYQRIIDRLRVSRYR